MGLSPEVTEEGNRMLIFSHSKATAEDFDPTVMLKRLGMMMDVGLLEGIVQNGLEVIVDFRHVCFAQMTRYNLALTKRVYDIGLVSAYKKYIIMYIIKLNGISKIRFFNILTYQNTNISFLGETATVNKDLTVIVNTCNFLSKNKKQNSISVKSVLIT